MTRSLYLVGALVLSLGLACRAQDPSSSGSSSSSAQKTPSPAASPQPQNPPQPAEAKKPKKVWTNDEVAALGSSVSVFGNSKNLGNADPASKADPAYIASVRKQLEKFRTDLADTNEQLAKLRSFSAGDPSVAHSGYLLNKGYGRVPVDQQIQTLEKKKKELEGKIEALLDEARKRGVQPGDLR